MSEALRSRLYDWLRAHTDESVAEYAMACLSPVPLGDLVTKQHLETVLAAEFSATAPSRPRCAKPTARNRPRSAKPTAGRLQRSSRRCAPR